MRHFTASTAIRQDGPLALSTLTGVVAVYRGHSSLRAVENLPLGSYAINETLSLSVEK